MTNTRKKGLRKELLCSKILEQNGWEIVFRSTTVKRGPCWIGLDFANLFDVVAIKPTTKELIYPLMRPDWRLISVKHSTSGRFTETREKLLDFKNRYAPPGVNVELWIWHPAKMRGRGVGKIWTEAHWEQQVIT